MNDEHKVYGAASTVDGLVRVVSTDNRLRGGEEALRDVCVSALKSVYENEL